MEIKRMVRREPALILAILLFFLFMINITNNATTSFGEDKQVVIEIPRGASLDQIAEILVDKGVISSKFIFKLRTKLNGWDNSIQAGTYLFEQNETVSDLLRKMHSGETMDTAIKCTVPEGYTVKQIAALLEKKGIISAQDFLQTVKTYKPEGLNLPQTEYPLEGYLFPDTYYFEPQSPPEEIIKVMLRRFLQVADKSYLDKLQEKGLTLHEAVTLASIVEREAVVDAERPLIAGVFLKRLAMGMPLQSCATVQFLLPRQKEKLTYEDLKIESPYNTYKHKGLPPGPIGNPGKASLQAVAEAKDEQGYLYFVSKNDGTHVFSRTLEEHNAAKEKYQ